MEAVFARSKLKQKATVRRVLHVVIHPAHIISQIETRGEPVFYLEPPLKFLRIQSV